VKGSYLSTEQAGVMIRTIRAAINSLSVFAKEVGEVLDELQDSLERTGEGGEDENG
jgi:hypothetical protein